MSAVQTNTARDICAGAEPVSPMCAAALAYAARGLRVFPADSSGAKKSHKAAAFSDGRRWGQTIDGAEIRRDFMRWPLANIGIATGPDSGIFVVEADTPEGHDVDGIGSLRALEAELGALPETLMAESPSGSLHWYFRWPGGIIRSSSSKIGAGIDVLGDGGMVMAPPSVRPGKGEYKWLNDNTIADAPRWIVDLATADDGDGERVASDEPEAAAAKIAAAFAIIPNTDAGFDVLNDLGMAAWRATRGSAAGFEAWLGWCQKSNKFGHLTAERHRQWREYAKYPPDRIGAGTIFYHADQVAPGWSENYDIAALTAAATNGFAGEDSPESGAADQKTNGVAVNSGAAERPKTDIHATPFVWIIPEKIPPRRWVYRPHYIRTFASLTVSTGGIGKSSELIGEATAMASGKPLLGTQPEKKLRVWYWNGEDPMDELQRRFAAAVKHYGLKPEDIGDRLFVDSGRVMPIVLAVELKRAPVIATPVIEGVIATLRENAIDVLMIDPFVSCHRVNENDNAAIERVAKSWSYIAEETNCSVMLAHHSRKTGGGEGVTVDDGRGASALLAAVRSARTLNNMSVREAENAGVDEVERRSYFRADVGKANLTPPAEVAEWFKLVSVDLENGGAGGVGDRVGVVTAWAYPKATAPSITADDVKRAQAAIKAGGRWREDQRSSKEPWVGIPIAKALGLDLNRKHQRRALVDLVAAWLAAGWVVRVAGHDAGRKPRTYIETGQAPPDEAPPF